MRRLGARFVALVAIGALITVCVAAASMVLVPPERMTVVHEGAAGSWRTTERAGFGVESVTSRWDGERTGRTVFYLLFGDDDPPRLPDWAGRIQPHGNTKAEFFHFGVMEMRGWPFGAFRGGVLEGRSFGRGGEIRSHWALVLGAPTHIPIHGAVTTTGDGLGLIGTDTRFIPLRPHLPGFLANTAIYGAAVGLLWFGPAAIRRASRRRRGKCESCGHLLAGSPRCPECGREVATLSPWRVNRSGGAS